MSSTNWNNNILNILKRCKLIDIKADYKFILAPRSIFHEVFQWSFGVLKEEEVRENQCWFINNALKIQLNDTNNYWPVTCMKVTELNDCSEFKIINPGISSTVHWYALLWWTSSGSMSNDSMMSSCFTAKEVSKRFLMWPIHQKVMLDMVQR